MEKIKFYFLWLVAIIIIIFILQNLPGIPGFTKSLILNENVHNGELWRYITSIFLHGGLPHLIYNLFALLFFGFILERIVGSNKFLFIFFISGVVANIIAVNFYGSSLGASGAIYGVLGAIIVLRPMMMVWAFGLVLPMFMAGILWIIGDIMGVFGFGSRNVGNIAHLSGIGVGIAYGLYKRFEVTNKKNNLDDLDIPEDYIEEWENRYVKPSKT